jgi:hypothetical protein
MGIYQWPQNRYNIIRRHSCSAFERESRLFYGNIGSPIKAFGDDEKSPGNIIKASPSFLI